MNLDSAMDYRTLFITFIASFTVYTVCACALAWRNREMHGLLWIAAGMSCAWVAVVLQGLEGSISTVYTSFLSNELYFPAYAVQMLGLTWFVDRRLIRLKESLVVGGGFAVLYAVLYALRVPYVANVINGPTIGFIAGTAWIMVRRGKDGFLLVSRVTAVLLVCEALVLSYRAILMNYTYADPWLVSGHQRDPRWAYSMMMLIFFTTCVVMCCFWFFVVEVQSELVQQARTDGLTGALNRRALEDAAERELSRSLRQQRPMCLLLLDVDDFKRLNDRFGHAAGDLVLKRAVAQVNANLRAQDLVARTGGEEFAVMLPDTSMEMALIVAERVRLGLESMRFPFGSPDMHVSVSIGVAESWMDGDIFEELIQRADAAMYSAKRAGKNRVMVFDEHRTAARPGVALPMHR
jgi:diguanylate cyclase (GGDEF)-like protein